MRLFADSTMRAKLLFVQNAAQIFEKFLMLNRPSIERQSLRLVWALKRKFSRGPPTQKEAFNIGARAFYITCAKYLILRLPLDNKVLLNSRFSKPSAGGESSIRSLSYIANALPQVIPPNKASVLAGEWNSLVCERTEKARQGFLGVFARKC